MAGSVMEAVAATQAAGWAEPLTLLVMLGVFALLAAVVRWPIGVALLLAAWLGAAVNGDFLPIRHLVEGGFSYLDPILVIATAMIFMQVLADGGALLAVGRTVERRLGTRPLLLVPILMLIVMFPGMITGSSTASVLTTGALTASILTGLGLARERAAAMIAMGGVLGMVAPPINIPAMIIGGGIDLPYAGFGGPLALASFPLALVLSYGLAWPVLRRRDRKDPGLPPPAGANDARLWRALAILLVLATLMLGPRVAPGRFPDIGLPLTFVLMSALGVALLRRFPLIAALDRATHEALPVLGILVGVGAFIQVMTLTGARGWLVGLMVGAPSWAVVAAAAVSLPLFGAVSAFGSASVLGVPFLLVLIGGNEVVTTAALSLLTALGDLMLPAALAVTLAAQAAGVADRRRVLRLCMIPALLAVAVAVAMLLLAPAIGQALSHMGL